MVEVLILLFSFFKFYLARIIIIIIIIIISSSSSSSSSSIACVFFTPTLADDLPPQLELQQITKIFLSILADPSKAVFWRVSILQMISN